VFLKLPSFFARHNLSAGLPAVGVMISPSSTFAPAVIKGVKIFPDNPLRFDFIVDSGDSGLGVGVPLVGTQKGQAQDLPLQNESQKLIKYFLAALTVPEEDFWVNLSPSDRE